MLGLLSDGANALGVDDSGADQFLGWAMVVVHFSNNTSTPVVIFSDPPSAALAQASSLCASGFDGNVPPQAVSVAVSVGEQCDDGANNGNEGDPCSNSCTEVAP